MDSRTYLSDDVYKASLAYFEGDEEAARVWSRKFALQDADGQYCELTPDNMFHRLAAELARVEQRYDNQLTQQEIEELLGGFRYLVPSKEVMRGVGTDSTYPSLSEGFVIGDSQTLDNFGKVVGRDAAQSALMKRCVGVAHDLSGVRPHRMASQGAVRQPAGLAVIAGRFSHSAVETGPNVPPLLLSVAVNHPDTFSLLDQTTGANQGVARMAFRMEDVFIRSVIDNRPYEQKYPVYSDNPLTQNEVNAHALWRKLVHKSWEDQRVGIFFWDTIVRESVADCYADLGFQSQSVMPCSGIPLSSYEGCPRMDINLYSYVAEPYTDRAIFRFDLLRSHVIKAQRLMDDLVDLQCEKADALLAHLGQGTDDDPVKFAEIALWKEIRRKAQQGRRTGLGTVGESEMLAAMGLYGSEEATAFAESVHKEIALACYRASVDLARERGRLEIYKADREKNNPFVNRIRVADPSLYDDMVRYGRRQIACLTVAPDPDLAMLVQQKNALASSVAPTVGEPHSEQEWFSMLRMQGRNQRWVDQTVVTEITLDNIENEDVVSEIYHEAWRCGCKQCIVVRTCDFPVSVDGADKRDDDRLRGGYPKNTPVRPRELDCDVVRFQNNKEKWIAFVGLQNGRPYEIFTGLVDDEDGLMLPKSVNSGKIIRNVHEDTGIKTYDFQFTNKYGYKITIEGLSHKFNPEYWNYAKLISGVMRYGMPIDQVVRLVGSLQLNSESINNWKVGVERALKKYVPDETDGNQTCPNCGERLVVSDGVAKCDNCGYTKSGV